MLWLYAIYYQDACKLIVGCTAGQKHTQRLAFKKGNNMRAYETRTVDVFLLILDKNVVQEHRRVQRDGLVIVPKLCLKRVLGALTW